MDENIINNIYTYLLMDSKKISLKAIKNLDILSRLKKSNFSYAIRELTREALTSMSPDEKVLSSRCFQPHYSELVLN